MRRLMALGTVVLLMMVMVVASAGAAQGLSGTSGSVKIEKTASGTPLPATVCQSPAAASPFIGWRGGQCWVFYPAP